MSSFSNLSTLAGSSARVAQIMEFCEILENKRNISQGKIVENKDKIAFDHCQIESPEGNILFDNLSFELTEGTNMIIMGYLLSFFIFHFH